MLPKHTLRTATSVLHCPYFDCLHCPYALHGEYHGMPVTPTQGRVVQARNGGVSACTSRAVWRFESSMQHSLWTCRTSSFVGHHLLLLGACGARYVCILIAVHVPRHNWHTPCNIMQEGAVCILLQMVCEVSGSLADVASSRPIQVLKFTWYCPERI